MRYPNIDIYPNKPYDFINEMRKYEQDVEYYANIFRLIEERFLELKKEIDELKKRVKSLEEKIEKIEKGKNV